MAQTQMQLIDPSKNVLGWIDSGGGFRSAAGYWCTEYIESRHSTRNFKPDKPIDRETQTRILNAGLRAPSPKNRQPWEFVVLDP